MRFPIWLLITAAVSVAAVIIFVGSLLITPPQALLVNAEFSLTRISPNADRVEDVTEFRYELSRNAFISLTFEAEDGTVYVFREDERRAEGEHRVLFSGVVDGYTLPDETIQGEVLRRLIPDGEYTWRLSVTAQDDDETAEATGNLIVEDADTPLPEMAEFSVAPNDFTPNQDGVNDRVMINVFITKEAELDVYLVDESDQRIPIPRLEEMRQAGEAGRQTYDYDGGVTIGADPPPDGNYTVVAEAQDEEGQIVRRTDSLTIRDGGRPLAEILSQPNSPTVIFDVQGYEERYFSTLSDDRDLLLGDLVAPPDEPQVLAQVPITMLVGDMLVFKLTVENYGTAPLRTTGPPPGTVYNQEQLAPSLGFTDQSGAWRVGIQCETTDSYPWRWAIGNEETLYTETDPANGNVYYYLPPGERSVVWGAIRMTELVETQNPQDCWAGLIHEDVGISQINSNVGRREIELVETGTSESGN